MSSSSVPVLARPSISGQHGDLGQEDGKLRTICKTLVMLFKISLGTLTPGTN